MSVDGKAVAPSQDVFCGGIQQDDFALAIEQHGRIGQGLEQPLQKAGFSSYASDMKGKLYRAGKMRRQLQELPGRLGVFGVLGLGEKSATPPIPPRSCRLA